MPSENCGCRIVCCKGCECCVEKNSKMDELEQKVLDLMTRQTTVISSDNETSRENHRLKKDVSRLEKDTNRLREHRNNLYLENKALKKHINELIDMVELLQTNVIKLKKQNQELN